MSETMVSHSNVCLPPGINIESICGQPFVRRWTIENPNINHVRMKVFKNIYSIFQLSFQLLQVPLCIMIFPGIDNSLSIGNLQLLGMLSNLIFRKAKTPKGLAYQSGIMITCPLPFFHKGCSPSFSHMIWGDSFMCVIHLSLGSRTCKFSPGPSTGEIGSIVTLSYMCMNVLMSSVNITIKMKLLTHLLYFAISSRNFFLASTTSGHSWHHDIGLF